MFFLKRKFFIRFFYIVLIILLSGLVLVQITYAALTCIVTDTCNSPDVIVFKMSGTDNAHAGLPGTGQSSYTNLVCCSGVDGLGNNCSGTYEVVGTLSGTNNAHFEQNDQTNYSSDYDVCLSVTSGSVFVAYRENSCVGDEIIIASMSGTSGTNAHVGGSTTYATKICATATAGAGPSVTAPASVTMSSYQLGGAGYNEYIFAAGELVAVVNAGSSGWSLTVSSTNMTGAKNIITNANILLRTDGTLATEPTIITSSNSLTGVTETTSGNYSLDSTRTIVSASAGNGIGTYNVRPTIRVNINNYGTYAETDTATLTFTVQ